MKLLDDYDLEGKRVLVRVDLNSPVNNGKVEGYERIEEHCGTIKALVKKKAKIVLLSWQGRKGEPDFISLKEHAQLLKKFSKIKIKFVPDVMEKKAVEAIEKLHNKEVLLLENVRFLKKSEEKLLVKTLSKYFDYYIFDAFSVAHRDVPSVTGFGKTLEVIAGKVMEKEFRGLEKIKHFKRPYVFVLGGGKLEDCLILIESKIKEVDYILCGGKIGLLGLYALGHPLDYSQYKEEDIEKMKKLLLYKKIILPVDLATLIHGKRKEFAINRFPHGFTPLDIGSKTIVEFSKILKKAGTAYLKGPMGIYDQKGCEMGQRNILKIVANSKAYSIAGGGHTMHSIDMFIKRKQIKYLSLSGGALLEYIAGKKLPGLEMMK